MKAALEALQKKLEILENERASVESEMSQPNVYADLTRFAEVAVKFQELNEAIAELHKAIEKHTQ